MPGHVLAPHNPTHGEAPEEIKLPIASFVPLIISFRAFTFVVHALPPLTLSIRRDMNGCVRNFSLYAPVLLTAETPVEFVQAHRHVDFLSGGVSQTSLVQVVTPSVDKSAGCGSPCPA